MSLLWKQEVAITMQANVMVELESGKATKEVGTYDLKKF